MGMDERLDLEVLEFSLAEGDRYLLCTDGIHDFLEDRQIRQIISSDAESLDAGLDGICSFLVERALAEGSADNCSALLLEVKSIDTTSRNEYFSLFRSLPFPPPLSQGMRVDGYEVERELQSTERSKAYLARDLETGQQVVMKIPVAAFEGDLAYIERFTLEGWIGRKLRSDRVARSYGPKGRQSFQYNLFEFIEGPSLESWMRENPSPDARKVTAIAVEILQGLRTMHRMEMLHQNLQPDNIILHPERGAVIIDFGTTRVGGIQEIDTPFLSGQMQGSRGYRAPEYFLGEKPTRQSDLFSLGVMVYEMLTGQLPYGPEYERCQSLRDFSNLSYRPATQINSHVPLWMDGAIRKAVSIRPKSRYENYSEFEYDLQRPNEKFLSARSVPYVERNPSRFWKGLSGILAAALFGTWIWIATR